MLMRRATVSSSVSVYIYIYIGDGKSESLRERKIHDVVYIVRAESQWLEKKPAAEKELEGKSAYFMKP